jgi:hypothetical protein
MQKPVLSFRSLAARATYTSFPKVAVDMSGIGITKKVVNETHTDSERITIRAIEDILTYCDHVVKLFSNDYVNKIVDFKWIYTVKQVMTSVLQSILDSKIDVGNACYENNEELDMVEDALETSWYNVNCYYAEDDELSDFISSTIDFWMGEIKDRGFLIHGLLVGSDDYFSAEISFKSLDRLDYPPKHGD